MDTDTEERRPCEDGGRGSYAATSQEHLGRLESGRRKAGPPMADSGEGVGVPAPRLWTPSLESRETGSAAAQLPGLWSFAGQPWDVSSVSVSLTSYS